MRKLLIWIVFIAPVALKAQSVLPSSFFDYTQQQRFVNNKHFTDSGANRKWFVTTYSGISTSFNFFKGGNATVVSAPLSLQLNRRLNNNLYAFAAVSAAPAYINFNNTFLSANNNKGWQGNNSLRSNSFGMYSKAELGLMYINDQKTFSISGSIGIQRNTYPVLPYNFPNTAKPNNIIVPN
ncbi:MAG: hypothetical protein ABI921_09680 [Panacibacter sp.]